MALDLEAERDITLIFERDDVREAVIGHCAKAHIEADAIRHCQYCLQFTAILGIAITEWLAMVDQDRAARAERRKEDHDR